MANTAELSTVPNRWLIVIAVMMVAVIEVLDSTIVNVALPHMMGSFGANLDEITWVLTSYIVSSAIVMLLTGFLIARLGRRRLLLINICGFLISSMLCGVAQTLGQIVFFRTLQGIFGASLVPVSQFVLRETFRGEEQGKAMAIWGIGIMVAPVLGPTVGAYITETMGWRWIFYINIPFCLVAFWLTWLVISETPIQKISIDWIGLISMALGVGCLQLFLDRGNPDDWFQSTTILILCVLSVLGLIVFIARGFYIENSIVNLRVFKNPLFAIGTFLMMIFCLLLFSATAVQPLMLQELYQYPVITTGELMAPRGVASAIGMIIVARWLPRLGPRRFLLISLPLSAYGSWLMSQYTLTLSFKNMLAAMVIQGLGMGMFFVPLSAVAMMYLSSAEIPAAAGLFSFGRGLGGSIGISLISTLVTRLSQINWHQLISHITPTDPRLQLWLARTGFSWQSPVTHLILAQTVGKQAQFVAYLDAYRVVAYAFLLIIPLVFFIPKKMARQKIEVAH